MSVTSGALMEWLRALKEHEKCEEQECVNSQDYKESKVHFVRWKLIDEIIEAIVFSRTDPKKLKRRVPL